MSRNQNIKVKTHFPLEEKAKYAAKSEIRASQSDTWVYKNPPPRWKTNDPSRARTRQCGFRESRSYTWQRVLRGFESLLELLLQCEQNWKCQIRLLPRLCICAHVWLLLYVYTHMYTSYLYRVVGLMAPRVIIFQASMQVNGIFFSVLNVIGTT